MAQARFAKLREYEDRLNAMKETQKEEQRAAHVSTWQARSDQKMKTLTIQRRLEALNLRREADLNARRQRLAEKLYQEDLALRQELVDGKETPEQRRAKLAARARELADKREAERQRLAAQLYEQAFVENCDVLRDTNSKRILYRTLDERNAQIEQRMASRIAEEEEKRMFTEMNETSRLKAEQRYLDDKRKKQELQQATIKVLDQQVRAIEQRRADEAAERQQEISELRALWQRMSEEQDAEDSADRERMRRLAAELQEFNRLRQMELTERERRERELDLQILQEALSREAADEAREADAREKRAADVRHYRQQLALMMANDAQDASARDAMIDAMAAQQQAKRDAELAARDEARRRLMAEVDAIRQQQIRDKRNRHLLAMEETAKDRADAMAAAAQEELDAQARRNALRKKNLEQRLEIQTQMVAKAHIKAAEEDEKLRAIEHAQEAESAYMGQVKEVLGKTDPPKWYGRKKFEWYT